MPQPPSPDLLAAYRAALYRVDDPDGPFTLRVDRESPELRDLLGRCSVDAAAFLTAWNPFSEQQTPEENAAAQRRLVAEARGAGFEVLPVYGEDPAGVWPGEESVLVLGIDEAAARAMAARYGQHAFVHCGPDAIPRLVLTAG